MAKICNIHELACLYGTSASRLDAVLSRNAGTAITIAEFPTGLRLDASIDGTNVTYSCQLRYPFEDKPVVAFVGHIGELLCVANPYDDPIDMLMNLTCPGEEWTLEDAGRILGEAEAQGWRFAPEVDAQFILDLYNDMEGENEDE